MRGRLTENLHSEKQTVASSHVGDHTAVLAAVLRPHFLYLQVLTSCQPLDTTAQLMEQVEDKEMSQRTWLLVKYLFCLFF